MNLRQFFTTNRWWGKIIGAFLGYLIGGAMGALFGLLIGNFFDRGLALHFARPHWHYYAERRKFVQDTFFHATFSVMGHIAKADGRVTEQQIEMAKILMRDMRLNAAQTKKAQDYFREGKQSQFDLWEMLSALRDATRDNPELLKLFFDIQLQAVIIAGFTIKKQHLLNSILHYMGFAPLHQQQRFYEDFARRRSHQRTKQEDPFSSSTFHGQQTTHTETDYAYAILGVSHNATQQEVKRAYRQLMSSNHPDKLIAKGLPESMIKIATEKTQQIRKAYERICQLKGW